MPNHCVSSLRVHRLLHRVAIVAVVGDEMKKEGVGGDGANPPTWRLSHSIVHCAWIHFEASPDPAGSWTAATIGKSEGPSRRLSLAGIWMAGRSGHVLGTQRSLHAIPVAMSTATAQKLQDSPLPLRRSFSGTARRTARQRTCAQPGVGSCGDTLKHVGWPPTNVISQW
jgi:hypothetical protein